MYFLLKYFFAPLNLYQNQYLLTVQQVVLPAACTALRQVSQNSDLYGGGRGEVHSHPSYQTYSNHFKQESKTAPIFSWNQCFRSFIRVRLGLAVF